MSPHRVISAYEEEVDISTSPGTDNVAVISAGTGTGIVFSWDCWISHPVSATRVIIDPGYISINVSCDFTCDGAGPRSAGSYFEVIAGHTYKHSIGQSCRRITDTNNDQIIIEDCN